jgi:hypothetical protein
MTMLPEGTSVLVKTAKTYAKDIAERVVWTFLVAVGSFALTAGPAGWLHVSTWQAAGTAGIAAVLTLVKSLAARYIGNRNSASTARGV